MADFNFYLNRQGIQGKKGEKGDQGFSPVISEGQNTSDTYTLNITNEYETFETPNLRGQFSIEDRGGKYVLYDAENNTLSASDPIPATAEIEGVVSRSTEEDFINVDETAPKFINPNGLFNAMPIVLDSPDDSIIIRQNPDTKRTELIVDGSGTQESLAQERAERIAADDLLRAGINDADSRIDNVISDLSTEQQIRLAADTQQQQQIDAERQERETQDASLQNQLSEKLTADNIKAGNNVTITRSGNNVTINSTGGGGGGTTYTAGDGIDISGDVISTRVDNQTIKIQDGVMHADLSEIGDELNALSGRVNTLEGEVVVATPNRLGLVKPDNSTIIINEEGELTSTVGGTVKFPNATIIGTPTINNGQISDFSTTNYLQFPFEFETQGRTWLLNGSFHTGSNVTTQQNIIDSLAAVALAVRNGRLVMALSTTGTTFDLGEAESMSDIEPNTSYYFRISFSGTQYMLSLSTDKIDYMPEAIVSSSTPIAARPMTISSSGHPYGDIINMNDWDLTVGNVMVWQGMADVGSASRMDVSASNADHSAYEVMKNTTALTSGNITDNTRLYNEVLDRSHSTFDLSKFTVVGTPTITDDGVASGFSNANYIIANNTAIPQRTIKVKGQFLIKSQGVSTVATDIFSFLDNNFSLSINPGVKNIGINGNWISRGIFDFDKLYEYSVELNINTNQAQLFLGEVGSEKSLIQTITRSGNTFTSGAVFIGSYLKFTQDTIDLKQFSIEVDGKEVFNGNKTGIDQIKKDDYTVVGSPTITDNGIASGFSSNNYLKTTDINIINSNNWKFDIPIRLNTVPTTGNFILSDNSNIETFRVGITTDRKLKLWLKTSDGTSIIDNMAGNTALELNNKYIISVSCKNGIYSLSLTKDNITTVEISKSSSAICALNEFILGARLSTAIVSPFTSGSIDLNSFKIYVDDNLVYQPTLRIPYTQSKTGSKIVEAQYRGRVEDVYNQTGEALYYTLDKDNKQAAAPICDIYGVLTRLNDSLGDISSLLDIINGEEVSALSTLVAMPMMLSLEPTELDLEDSFNSSIERATYDCDLDITPLDYESYDDDDTDIDLGGNK